MSIIPNVLIEKLKRRLGVPNQGWSLENLKRNGFNPKLILDIGAYEGKWTEEVLTIFPSAHFLMIEAQINKEIKLKSVVKRNIDKVEYKITLLSSKDNEQLLFNQYETASSVLVEHFETGAQKTLINSMSLDSLVSDTKFQKSDFIKLDTQGFELEILKGGKNTLKDAQVVLMEVSFIDIYKNGPLVLDVLNFMDKNDFQVYDICSIMRRPLDKALFQSDLIFVKKESSLIQNKKWI